MDSRCATSLAFNFGGLIIGTTLMTAGFLWTGLIIAAICLTIAYLIA